MSSRIKKRLRNRMAKQVINKKVTPDEARRALAAAGITLRGRKAAPMAAKTAAAGTDPLYKSRQPGLTAQQQSLLEVYNTHSSPAVREAAFQAAYPERGTT